jgi:hypothetical protein
MGTDDELVAACPGARVTADVGDEDEVAPSGSDVSLLSVDSMFPVAIAIALEPFSSRHSGVEDVWAIGGTLYAPAADDTCVDRDISDAEVWERAQGFGNLRLDEEAPMDDMLD